MNIINDFKMLNISDSDLGKKKQQTDYKIRYVSEYIRLWAIISAERVDVEDINFIDCMCNAGVYADGDCCTAIEVLNIFIEIANRHKYKNFNLYLNDYDKNKIDIVSKIVNHVYSSKISILRVYIENKDVNDYLDALVDDSSIFGRGKSTVLYIDPFDFGTVIIPKVSEVLKKNYCEVIFNFFSSDYRRNIRHDKERIKKCIGGLQIEGKEEIVKYIGQQLRVEAISKCKTGDTCTIGAFKGFELLVEKNFMGANYLVLRGKTDYKAELSTSPVGNMVKLENLFNALQENEEFLLKKIEDYKNDLKASRKEYEKPFAYEEELQEKVARQYELNTQLDLENGKVEDVDLGGIDEDIEKVAEADSPYRVFPPGR